MALIDFQIALGRFMRACDADDPLRRLTLDDRERASLTALKESAGFRVTVAIQRSWCEGRAAKAAHLTLSLLDERRRKRLLHEWADSGSGTSSFYEAEANSFLDYLSKRLDDPSEALTVCRIEHATLRASAAAEHFVKPDNSRVDDPECVVRAADCAALVHCDTEPRYILFGPGLDGLWRPASQEEANLWAGVSAAVSVSELLRTTPHERRTIEALLDAGAIEFISAK